MDSRSIDKIRHALNTDVVRRMLIQYFVGKGFTESFDRIMYPAVMQDLTVACPVLAAKVEVVPHCVDIDPVARRAVLGWNLFVLGTQRMYLGETHHQDLGELARQIQMGMISPQAGQIMPSEGMPRGVARRQTTPRQVIAFLTRVLGQHESGYVDLTPTQQAASASMSYGNGAGRFGLAGAGSAGVSAMGGY
jgi:hypothetical protein